MLTPPYNFSIVASSSYQSPPIRSDPSAASDIAQEVLYRGSIPAERNLTFVAQKRLRTIVYLTPRQFGRDETLVKWPEKQGGPSRPLRSDPALTVVADDIELAIADEKGKGSAGAVSLIWVKAELMGEEKLGIGKNEISQILKIALDRSSYPLYIADRDGISHTTLIIACLRKLQGWHMDSIVDEICRFEPNHEDFSLVPFITSFLSSPDTDFVLPPPPYPSWLWPTPPPAPAPAPAPASQSSIQSGSLPLEAKNETVLSPTPLPATSIPSAPAGPSTQRMRERTKLETSANRQSPLLPFPHPLQARRHPTMRLTFPAVSNSNHTSPLLPAANPNINVLSRVSTRVERVASDDFRVTGGDAASGSGTAIGKAVTSPEIPGISGATTEASSKAAGPNSAKKSNLSLNRTKTKESESFSRHPTFSSQATSSTDTLDRQDASMTPEEMDNSLDDGEMNDDDDEVMNDADEVTGDKDEDDDETDNDDEDDDDDDDEEDADEDMEDGEDSQPTSQYISALDLAGFT